jgi:hypothetical protein
MTVLLRSIDIHARMVVGFLPGQFDSETKSYIIRDRDYHAWTEVYFPGYGWIKYDGTPGNAIQGTVSNPLVIPPVLPENAGATEQDPNQDTTTGDTFPISLDKSYIGLIISVISSLIILLLCLAWLRIYRKPSSSSSIYSRMVLLASIAGLGPKPWQTALEFSAKLSSALPQQAPVVNKVVQGYIVTHYGNKLTDGMEDYEIINSWPKLRNALLKRCIRTH